MDCSPLGFSVHEISQASWSGLPFTSPGDLPDPGVEPVSPTLAGGFFTTEPAGKPQSQFFSSLYHTFVAVLENVKEGCQAPLQQLPSKSFIYQLVHYIW